MFDFSGIPSGIAVRFDGDVGEAAINVSGGTFTFAEDAGDDNPNLVVNVAAGGTVIFDATQHLAELNITGGGAIVAMGGDSRIVTHGISVRDGGTLDLNDNSLLLAESDVGGIGTWDGSGYSGVTGLVASAYSYGAWDGHGIGSTAAGASAGVTTLAVRRLANCSVFRRRDDRVGR